MIDALADARQSARETGEAARRFADFRYATLDLGRASGGWSPRRRRCPAPALPARRTIRACRHVAATETHPARALYEEFTAPAATPRTASRSTSSTCSRRAARQPVRRQHAAPVLLHLRAHPVQPPARALARTADKLASAYPGTLRLRLLKIGARVRVSARRIHVAMAGGCPDKAAFAAAWRALVPT